MITMRRQRQQRQQRQQQQQRQKYLQCTANIATKMKERQHSLVHPFKKHVTILCCCYYYFISCFIYVDGFHNCYHHHPPHLRRHHIIGIQRMVSVPHRYDTRLRVGWTKITTDEDQQQSSTSITTNSSLSTTNTALNATNTANETMIIPKTRTHKTNAVRAKSWDEQYEELIKFKLQYGHVNVPQKPSDALERKFPRVANFCRNQRTQYKLLTQGDEKRSRSFLTQDRIERLESIGFIWDAHEAAWMERYDELKQFFHTYGHTNVPTSMKEKNALRQWCSHQRIRYKGPVEKYKPLSAQQIEMLESINFLWTPKDREWWINYVSMKKYHDKHGTFHVPSIKLRRWKGTLRSKCKEYVTAVSIVGSTKGVSVSGLNRKRLIALKAINFCWLPRDLSAEVFDEIPPDDIFAGYQEEEGMKKNEK